MSDDPSRTDNPAKTPAQAPLGAKGFRALQIVAALPQDKPSGLDTVVAEFLADAAFADHPDELPSAVALLYNHGLHHRQIADIVLPAAARILGDRWCEDKLGFAEVTVGAARLQNLLRDLGPEWTGELRPDPNAPSVLVVQPANNHHTLGGVVIAGLLRRKGFDVATSYGEKTTQLRRRVDAARFDMVLISASGTEPLGEVERLVTAIRSAAQHQGPIVLGGMVLNQKESAKRFKDVDYLTSDLEEALNFCGLTKQMGLSPRTAPVS